MPKKSFRKFTKEEKSEYRRLVQNANRRVQRAHEAWAKEGLKVPPSFLTGGKQWTTQFETNKYAWSRGMTHFENEKQYRQALEFFKSFDPKTPGQHEKRPTVTEYREIQQVKTFEAMKHVLGVDLSIQQLNLETNEMESVYTLYDKLKQLSAPKMSKFWKAFSDRAKHMGLQYSSNEAMAQTLKEFFPEDWKSFNNVRAENAGVEAFVADMMKKKA
jgi:hypothetical protein